LCRARTQNPSFNKLASLVEYPSAEVVQRDFEKGAIDIAFLTLDEALKVTTKVKDLVVFKVINFSNGADAIIGQKGVNSLKDISGKIVGYESTALGAYMLHRALEFASLKATDVKAITVPLNNHIEAFLTKKVDVIVTFEPNSSKLIASGGNILFDSSQIPYEVIDLMVIRKSTLMKNREQVQEILKIWDQTIDSFLSDKLSSLFVINQRLKMDKEDLFKVYNKLQFAQEKTDEELLKILKDSSKHVIEGLKELKHLPKDYQLSKSFFELM
ncbi:MAG: hypothetical protein EP326_04250, partial [Deltaproteobacteria bacterium]